MRNSVLVAVVAAVLVVITVVCGILCGVSEVSNRMEMADRADAMEYVGVDTSYYAYCEAVDRADSLEMVYEFVDSVYYHVKDSLISRGVDLNLDEEFILMWKLYTSTDMEYRNAKIDVKYAKKHWLRHQEEYDNEIKQLRRDSEDYMPLIFYIFIWVVVLLFVYIVSSCMYEQARDEEKEEAERIAWKNRTILTCPLYIMENGNVVLVRKRVVLNDNNTERDMYDNYVDSCVYLGVPKSELMTFEQWYSCCE